MSPEHAGNGGPFRDFGTDGLVHLPGLDGLRGLAVLAVICFHGNWPWMRGGYLGVSLFFTLSGFLITSLLLVEHRRHGGNSLRGFWSRRFRRLLPAAWLTLLAVVVAGWFLLDAAQVVSFRGDVLASLAQVANWRFLLAGVSYGDLFRSPSPVLHFWSLSIEEQFYLVFPLLLMGLLALTRGRRTLAIWTLGLAAAVSWFLPVVLGASVDRIYYGTDTRAGELLAGAVLAFLVSNGRLRRRVVGRMWPRGTVVIGGMAALAVTVAMWIGVERSSSFISSGGLALVSVMSVLVVLAAAIGIGPVAALCAWRPLRWIGGVSYGAYLFHWPLFVFLSEKRTGLSHLPRFVLVVSLTFVLATLSLRFVEQPVRLRRGWFAPGRVRPIFVAPVVVIALIVSVLLLDTDGRRETFDFEQAQAQLDQIHQKTAQQEKGSPPTTQAAIPAPPRPRVSFYGDSTMLSLALLLGNWELQGGPVTSVEGDVQLGCGIARGGQRKVFRVEPTRPECDSWATTWAQDVQAGDPDVTVVAPGQWELVDHKMAGDKVWRRIGDPKWDDYVRSEILAANDVLASNGSLVVWLAVPQFGSVDADSMPRWQRESHQAWRVDRLNEILREAVAQRPDTARLVDLSTWMAPHTNDTNMRDDGTHYNWTAENPVVRDFVGPAVVREWDDWWTGLAELAAGRELADGG